MRAADIRTAYIDFFRLKAGHTHVPGSPVVPYDDPTLLFTNAGMNQFKDVFLGRGTRPYTRAVNSQKCIRAGGKHNDLEDVGKDVYHHTFFEMLGNWSFGDYFKEESIAWGWELLTETFGLAPERLYATYFGGNANAGLAPDDEARDIWRRFLPVDRVLPGSMKDNFWEMGESGPCGPCSEIHFDRIGGRDAASLVNSGDPDVLEIWNHVFIQFNRENDGSLKQLPARHVDTGMGFERLVSVVQGKRSNYDTDLWSPIFSAIHDVTGARAYGGNLHDHIDIAYRVIADHVRCLTAAACDGAGPGSEGRNYVLRRILRRAARHGRQTLGMERPFVFELVPAVVATLGDAFPEIAAGGAKAKEIIRAEEELFGRTLGRGIALFEESAARGAIATPPRIVAEDAFRLHDTWGFPIDLTEVMALERGFTVDVAGYQSLMERARETSRAVAGDAARIELSPDALAKLAALHIRPTDDSYRDAGRPMRAHVAAIWDGKDFHSSVSPGSISPGSISPGSISPGRQVGIVLDKTCFYAESGGQETDHGDIRTGHFDGGGTVGDGNALGSHGVFHVQDVQRFGDYILHIGQMHSGIIRAGDSGEIALRHERREALRANHTATHLLNLALREVVGGDVQQRGSLVAADRLRFDYAGSAPLSAAQCARVEQIVNQAIARDLPVDIATVDLAKARAITGLRAVFGERYPDPVRVVCIGATVEALLADPTAARWGTLSTEFCGGTHLTSTAAAQAFVLLGEGASSAGVRRCFGLTGSAAQAANQCAAELEQRIECAAKLEGDALLAEVAEIARLESTLALGMVARARLMPKIDGLRERAKDARRKQEGSTRDGAVAQVRDIVERHATGNATRPLVAIVNGADAAALMAAIDSARARLSDTPILFLSPDSDAGKVAIAATSPPSAIARGIKAGDWVKVTAQACGGSGGGKPDTAQAGGKDPSKVAEALTAALAFATRA